MENGAIKCMVHDVAASYVHGKTKAQPSPNWDRKTRTDLLEGPIDKPAYFVVKNVNADKYRSHSNLLELYEKNGYVFFKRSPN